MGSVLSLVRHHKTCFQIWWQIQQSPVEWLSTTKQSRFRFIPLPLRRIQSFVNYCIRCNLFVWLRKNVHRCINVLNKKQVIRFYVHMFIHEWSDSEWLYKCIRERNVQYYMCVTESVYIYVLSSYEEAYFIWDL